MYECPIIITMMRDFTENQMIERDNAITLKIQEKIGIDVDKEELIKALNYDRQQYEKGYADAKAEYAPKWTRFEDGLPEDGERVLIYADTEDAYEIAKRHLVEFSEDEYEWEVFSTFGYEYALDDEDVIAWMPLPKPCEPQDKYRKEQTEE